MFHITDDVREWDYGDFEGLKPAEIQARSPGWTIWTDGYVHMQISDFRPEILLLRQLYSLISGDISLSFFLFFFCNMNPT